MRKINISRREFTKIGCKIIIGIATGTVIIESLIKNSTASTNLSDAENYDWNKHYWSFVVDNNKCIGCGRCANACKLENHVPFDEPWYRTWVERYRIKKDGETKTDSPNGVLMDLMMIFLPRISKRHFIHQNYVIIAITHHVFRHARSGQGYSDT